MKNPVYIHDYVNFWLYNAGYHSDPKWKNFKAVLGHGYPLSDAVWQLHTVHPSGVLIAKILPELTTNYEELKKLRKTETGLYWSNTGGWKGDGMEVAIGGNGVRPTINSYMYSQALALSKMYLLQNNKEQAEHYQKEAEQIADLMMKVLWDKKDEFFKVLRQKDIPTGQLADVRELFGYVPWCYSIPPKNKGYEKAWSQLMDKMVFMRLTARHQPNNANQNSQSQQRARLPMERTQLALCHNTNANSYGKRNTGLSTKHCVTNRLFQSISHLYQQPKTAKGRWNNRILDR